MSTDPNLTKLNDVLIQKALDIAENGQTVVDPTSGEPVTISMTAAMFNAFNNLLKRHNITAAVKTGSPASRLAEAMKGRNIKFPIAPQATDTDEEAVA